MKHCRVKYFAQKDLCIFYLPINEDESNHDEKGEFSRSQATKSFNRL